MKRLAIFIVVLLFFINQVALAGGFQSLLQSQYGTGMAGSVSALNLDGSVVYYNPGSMSFLGKNSIVAGGGMAFPKTAFRSNVTGKVFNMENKNIPLYYIGGNFMINEKFAAGLILTTPYAYHSVWETNWQGQYILQSSKLSNIQLQPSASYKISEKIGLGAGIVFSATKFDWSKNLIFSSESKTSIKSQSNGVGFNVGLHYQINEQLNMTLDYRSKIKHQFKNSKVAFEGIPSSLSNYYPSSANADADMPLPSVLSLAFCYNINKELKIHFETNLTGWSSFDSLNYKFDSDYAYLNSEFKQARKYRDALAIRLGVHYQLIEKLALRAGVAFDQSPVKENFITPDMPDADKYQFGLGLSLKLNNHIKAECSYLFETKTERQGTNRDTQLNGSYNSLSHQIGLGLTYTF